MASRTAAHPSIPGDRDILVCVFQRGAADALNALLDKPISKEYRLSELLARPQLSYEKLVTIVGQGAASSLQEDRDYDSESGQRILQQARQQAEIQIKYQGYIDRQAEEIARLKRQEDTSIPEDFDYEIVQGLSAELTQKLQANRPKNIGRASRIPGMTPAAISLLLIYLKKYSRTTLKAS